MDAVERTANGELDKEIDFLAEFLREYHEPVYLRIGYEFDSKENNYDAPAYIKAFRRIVDRIRDATFHGSDNHGNILSPCQNVVFVWHAADLNLGTTCVWRTGTLAKLRGLVWNIRIPATL